MNNFINLVPLEYRRKVLLRQRVTQWFAVWLAVAAVAAALACAAHVDYADSRQALERAERACAPLERWIAKSRTVRGELDKLHAQGTLLQQLSDQRSLLSLLGAASQSAAGCDDRLFVQSLVFNRNPRGLAPATHQGEKGSARKQKDEEPDPGPWAFVTFHGQAKDNVAVASFVAGLRGTSLFRRVELKSSVQTDSSQNRHRSYTIECEIK
jgi:hypothetical protein